MGRRLPTRRDAIVKVASGLATAPLVGTLFLAPRKPSPELARQALYARAEALIQDFREAGASLSMTSWEPDSLWISVPIGHGNCDYERVEVLKRKLIASRQLYPVVLQIVQERLGFVAAVSKGAPRATVDDV